MAPKNRRRGWKLEAWIAGMLLLAGGLIALVLTLGEGMIHRNRKPVMAEISDANPPPTPIEPPALAALEKFFEAPDTASKSLFVRDTARVRPMMEDYHDKRNHPYQTLGRVSPGHRAEIGNGPCVLFEIEPFSGPRYPVAVVWDNGRFLIDWESLTAYGTMDWSEFAESRPRSIQILRVFVSKIPEDRKIPGLPEGSRQFLIEHRDDPEPMIVVAEAGAAATLEPLAARSPVTLEMIWKPIGPGGAPVACVSRVAATGWSHSP
jgi:hypothetical protein